MKQRGKQLLARVSPDTLAWLSGLRLRRHLKKLHRQTGLARVTDDYLRRHASGDLLVQDGPFPGMRYLRDATGSALLPKLIGSYELELRPALDQIIATGYESVIDVGCAEGYYAVGLALRLPTAAVFAFDTDPYARKLCRRMAALNAVADRLTVAGFCSPATLDATIRGRTLVLCDCEGYEQELLDPLAAKALAAADVLVEFHDVFRPGVTAAITARFAPTHDVTLFSSTERDPSQFPALAGLPPDDQRLAVSEFRLASQQWAFMRRRA